MTKRKLPRLPFAERGTLSSPGSPSLSTLLSDLLCNGLVRGALIVYHPLDLLEMRTEGLKYPPELLVGE